MTYLSDVVALTQKHLGVELREQDTPPEMLVSVLSTPITVAAAPSTGAFGTQPLRVTASTPAPTVT